MPTTIRYIRLGSRRRRPVRRRDRRDHEPDLFGRWRRRRRPAGLGWGPPRTTSRDRIRRESRPASVTIDSPSSADPPWSVGDTISFSGTASDPEDGDLPASAYVWTLIMRHCPSNCHSHIIETFSGVQSGSFVAPDHDYPSHLLLSVDVTDLGGLLGARRGRAAARHRPSVSGRTSPAGIPITRRARDGHAAGGCHGDREFDGVKRVRPGDGRGRGEQLCVRPLVRRWCPDPRRADRAGHDLRHRHLHADGSGRGPLQHVLELARSGDASRSMDAGRVRDAGDVDWYRFKLTATTGSVWCSAISRPAAGCRSQRLHEGPRGLRLRRVKPALIIRPLPPGSTRSGWPGVGAPPARPTPSSCNGCRTRSTCCPRAPGRTAACSA